MRMLKPMKPHLTILPKKLHFGFRNCTPQLGHFSAESLTSDEHSGQFIIAISFFLSPF
tara:strand:- start:334 stop:507 length:174 start_codon:yes stop_codon:yes gene_type:complete